MPLAAPAPFVFDVHTRDAVTKLFNAPYEHYLWTLPPKRRAGPLGRIKPTIPERMQSFWAQRNAPGGPFGVDQVEKSLLARIYGDTTPSLPTICPGGRDRLLPQMANTSSTQVSPLASPSYADSLKQGSAADLRRQQAPDVKKHNLTPSNSLDSLSQWEGHKRRMTSIDSRLDTSMAPPAFTSPQQLSLQAVRQHERSQMPPPSMGFVPINRPTQPPSSRASARSQTSSVALRQNAEMKKRLRELGEKVPSEYSVDLQNAQEEDRAQQEEQIQQAKYEEWLRSDQFASWGSEVVPGPPGSVTHSVSMDALTESVGRASIHSQSSSGSEGTGHVINGVTIMGAEQANIAMQDAKRAVTHYVKSDLDQLTRATTIWPIVCNIPMVADRVGNFVGKDQEAGVVPPGLVYPAAWGRLAARMNVPKPSTTQQASERAARAREREQRKKD